MEVLDGGYDDRSSSSSDLVNSESSAASALLAQQELRPKQSFSFVHITNPKQAKDKKNKRMVRSHAMQDYNASRKRQRGKPASVSITQGGIVKPHEWSRTSSSDSCDNDGELASNLDAADSIKNSLRVRMDTLQDLVPHRSSGGHKAASQVQPEKDLSRYYRVLLVLNRTESKQCKLQDIFVQDDDMLERVWKAGFVKPYCIRGLGNADPFLVLPQFRNPLIYMAELKMWCTRRFGTNAMAVDWVPALAQSRLTYLAALCVGATDMDVANGLSSESAITVAVKTEVIELVNEHLAKTEEQYTDDSIMAVQLLLCGEVATGNEWTWSIHEHGLTKMILQRDGLQTLGINGNLAVVVCSVMHVMNVLRESQPHDIYKEYVPQKTRSSQQRRAIPESPVYCPTGDFYTIVRSKHCSERLYGLLHDVRDLTDDFINRDDQSRSQSRSEDGFDKTRQELVEHALDREMMRKIREFPRFDAARDAPSYGAWMSEACRIASLIYATAIAARVPFSQAAVLVDAQDEEAPSFESALPRCLHKLRDAVANSSVSESWGEMIGVLFWVALVGGAAARCPQPAGEWTDSDEWTRKYFASTAMRIMVLLCFEYGEATMTTLRRLNEVQLRLVCSLGATANGLDHASLSLIAGTLYE